MPDPARTDLPIPDFDHLSVTALGHRIRSLDVGQIDSLLEFERAHGNRLPVVQVLQMRRRAVAEGAETSDGDASAPPADTSAPAGGSKVSPDTQGPVQNPPSQGVPTNPAQPRT
ncbi:hypothetical protein [Cellulomonas carbonis]|uniref:DUF8129 domain-containing protein n=1 Tax=Cellulomonas carbonis T26 TaxID=947969 RepID=A0A0A0BRQ4_9CELL|nr:hypothetical protein [Cellulomonas carbonis]KGM10646.1 hypothetical protein N868_14200 [Cellulomonas carbonis T26]GGB92192.1 hypothetical protein GCM10010972_01080 [Cellulomonas carbonis]